MTGRFDVLHVGRSTVQDLSEQIAALRERMPDLSRPGTAMSPGRPSIGGRVSESLERP